jgi:hypothetical protein
MIFRRIFTAVCLAAILISLAAAAVNAGKQHEDPAAIKEDFSGISLLLYYSDLLDMVQQGNLENIGTAINKLDYVSVPANLQKTHSDITGQSVELFQSVKNLASTWQDYSSSLGRVQTEEIQGIISQLSGETARIREHLGSVEQSMNLIDKYLKIESLPPDSSMKTVYQDIVKKISRLEAFVDSVDLQVDQGKNWIESLQATQLSLDVPSTAFFSGEEIKVSGFLAAGATPLAGREIEIRLDHAYYTSVQSDSGGFFKAPVSVPYIYSPEVALQAVFFPGGQDADVYSGTISPLRQLQVAYYQADLRIGTEEKAYPGRDTTITVELDYAPGTPLQSREAEIYLDNSLAAQFFIADSASQNLRLDPAISTGSHTLVVSIKADGRYAPALSVFPLEVIKAVPVLEMVDSGTVLVPGSLFISGKISSEIGPLQNAGVNLNVRGSTASVMTDSEGQFETKMLMGLGTDLLNSQAMKIEIQPEEAWNSPLNITQKIFMVNLPNCAILLVVLAALSYYLPRRFRGRSRKSTVRDYKKTDPSAPEAVLPVPTAAVSRKGGENLIFDLYRFALKLVTALTHAVLKPHQTLREFAGENSPALGKLSRYFVDFTRLIEKLLYSRHKATQNDLQKSRELYESMAKGARHENL